MYVEKRPWHADLCNCRYAQSGWEFWILYRAPLRQFGPDSKIVISKRVTASFALWSGSEAWDVETEAEEAKEFVRVWGTHAQTIALYAALKATDWQPLEANAETRAETASLAAVSWSKDEKFRAFCTQEVHNHACRKLWSSTRPWWHHSTGLEQKSFLV